MSLHVALRRQSFAHVPEVHVPLQVEPSVQSNSQKFELHVAEHFAPSSQRMVHGPAVHASEHVLASMQVRLQGGLVQTKLHVFVPVHSQLPPHSFAAGVVPVSGRPLSTPPLEDVPPPSVPESPPLLVPLPPLELLVPLPPPPIVQSYEQAATLDRITTPRTSARGTLQG